MWNLCLTAFRAGGKSLNIFATPFSRFHFPRPCWTGCLGRCRVGLCSMDLEESGSCAVPASDFHDIQIGVVQHVDEVLTWRKLAVPRMERKWDVYFKVPGNLRFRFRWIHRQGKGQGDEQRQQSVSCCLLQFHNSSFLRFRNNAPSATLCGKLVLNLFSSPEGNP